MILSNNLLPLGRLATLGASSTAIRIDYIDDMYVGSLGVTPTTTALQSHMADMFSFRATMLLDITIPDWQRGMEPYNVNGVPRDLTRSKIASINAQIANSTTAKLMHRAITSGDCNTVFTFIRNPLLAFYMLSVNQGIEFISENVDKFKPVILNLMRFTEYDYVLEKFIRSLCARVPWWEDVLFLAKGMTTQSEHWKSMVGYYFAMVAKLPEAEQDAFVDHLLELDIDYPVVDQCLTISDLFFARYVRENSVEFPSVGRRLLSGKKMSYPSLQSASAAQITDFFRFVANEIDRKTINLFSVQNVRLFIDLVRSGAKLSKSFESDVYSSFVPILSDCLIRNAECCQIPNKEDVSAEIRLLALGFVSSEPELLFKLKSIIYPEQDKPLRNFIYFFAALRANECQKAIDACYSGEVRDAILNYFVSTKSNVAYDTSLNDVPSEGLLASLLRSNDTWLEALNVLSTREPLCGRMPYFEAVVASVIHKGEPVPYLREIVSLYTQATGGKVSPVFESLCATRNSFAVLEDGVNSRGDVIHGYLTLTNRTIDDIRQHGNKEYFKNVLSLVNDEANIYLLDEYFTKTHLSSGTNRFSLLKEYIVNAGYVHSGVGPKGIAESLNNNQSWATMDDVIGKIESNYYSAPDLSLSKQLVASFKTAYSLITEPNQTLLQSTPMVRSKTKGA